MLSISRPRIVQRDGGEGVGVGVGGGGRGRGGEQQQYITPFELPLQHQLASVEQLEQQQHLEIDQSNLFSNLHQQVRLVCNKPGR